MVTFDEKPRTSFVPGRGFMPVLLGRGVYAAFVMEVKQNAYRLKYASPQVLDKNQWGKYRLSQAPNFDYSFQGNEGWIKLTFDEASGKWRPPRAPKDAASLGGLLGYCTVSMTGLVAVVAPEVPVTVMV
jgi:hypothetical protein